jgi:disulfide bond formation protein DsbB
VAQNQLNIGRMMPFTPHHPLAQRAWLPLFFAWLISMIATASALFIGEVMGMMPCVLCWYQRIAMFPLVLFLGFALIQNQRGFILPSLLLSLCGLCTASYHTALYWNWLDPTVTPCGDGPSCKQQVLQILGVVDLPMLSWLAFAAISVLLMWTWKLSRDE